MELLVPSEVRDSAVWALRSLEGLVAAEERAALALRHPHQRLLLRPEALVEGAGLKEALAVGGWAWLVYHEEALVGQVWVQEVDGRLSPSVGRRGNEQALAEALSGCTGDVYLISLPTLAEEALWLLDSEEIRRRPKTSACFQPPRPAQAVAETWRVMLVAAAHQQELARLEGTLAALRDGVIRIGAPEDKYEDKDEGDPDGDGGDDALDEIASLLSSAAHWSSYEEPSEDQGEDQGK